jgi:hypothetical protein
VPDGAVFRYRAFVFENGVMHDVPPFQGHIHSFCHDVTESGLVIGWNNLEFDGGGGTRAFLWQNGLMADLATRLPPGSLFRVRPESISALGQIVGQAIAPFGGNGIGFVITPSQYPSAMSDITQDCRVNIDDLLMLINDWGLTDSPADINHDKAVNIDDLIIMINEWSP